MVIVPCLALMVALLSRLYLKEASLDAASCLWTQKKPLTGLNSFIFKIFGFDSINFHPTIEILTNNVIFKVINFHLTSLAGGLDLLLFLFDLKNSSQSQLQIYHSLENSLVTK